MACVATWNFGVEAVLAAAKELEREENCLDAVEKGVNVVEDDPTTGRYFIGRGCYPNSEGVVQLDAALMRGRDCAFGAVAALEGYAKPISVARCVLEHASLSMLVGSGAAEFAQQQGFQMEDNDSLLTEETRRAFQVYSFPDETELSSQWTVQQLTIHEQLDKDHRPEYAKPISVARCVLEHASLSMLVGSGAAEFAQQQGFQMEDNDSLLTEETRRAFQEYKASGTFPDCEGHETLSVLCLDTRGGIAAGVSTSGPPFKPPGRVGDSPLPGCGLYADDQAGAAAASGDGEKILQFCPSFHIVQKMREGQTPQQACDSIVSTMKERSGKWFEVAIIALDTKGNVGAASTVKEWKDFRDGKVYPGFPYAVWKLGSQPEIKTQPVT